MKWNFKNQRLRSKLEEKVLAKIAETVTVKYEPEYIEYTVPESSHKYTPDFKVADGVFIEAKGIFESEDRKKHLLIKSQRPDITIYFVFQNPYAKIYKGSPTSYASWCDKHGFEYIHYKDPIPEHWLSKGAKNVKRSVSKKRQVGNAVRRSKGTKS